ncbi:lipopolysaccharide biosynthesis protein [Naumannella halotolerans]|uniref:lipopolysaccharide biosynthesis protein n=1 Tax=Naumannella halotolerans TaxID=993414 RepID=UPI00370D8A79
MPSIQDVEQPDDDAGAQRDLFGRGFVYAAVWSTQLAVSTLVSPILAHVLPIQEFGSLAAAIALYQLLTVLTVFGLDQTIEMRRVEDPDGQRSRLLLARAILFSWSVTLIVALSSPWWAPVFGFNGAGGLVAITLGWTAPGAAVLLMLGFIQAEDRLARFATVSILASAGGPLFGLLLVAAGEARATTYALGGVFAQCLALLLGLLWTKPRFLARAGQSMLRTAFVLAVPLGFAALSQYVLNAADRLVVQRILGETEVARYQVAFVIGQVLSLLLTFTNRAWLPRLKGIVQVPMRWRVIEEARNGIYLLVAWAVLGVTVASPVLLRVFAPASYHPEDGLVTVVFLVACSAFPLASVAASGQLLITVDRSGPLAVGAAVAVLTKAVVTAALITPLGIVGAATGTLVALLAQAVVLRWFAVRTSPPRPWNRRVLGVAALLVALALASVATPQTLWWNAGKLVLGILLLVPFFMTYRRLVANSGP